jgi:predicted Rossmann-fold nucleotide-binding protein
VHLARALVVFPGGFGTLDELFEVLTLEQTRKLPNRVPVLIYGTEYWNRFINFNVMVEHGMVSPSDLDFFAFADTPQEAFECLKLKLA